MPKKSKYSNPYLSTQKTKAFVKNWSADLRQWKYEGKTFTQAYNEFKNEKSGARSKVSRTVFSKVWQNYHPTISLQRITLYGKSVPHKGLRASFSGGEVDETRDIIAPRGKPYAFDDRFLRILNEQDNPMVRLGNRDRLTFGSSTEIRRLEDLTPAEKEKILPNIDSLEAEMIMIKSEALTRGHKAPTYRQTTVTEDIWGFKE